MHHTWGKDYIEECFYVHAGQSLQDAITNQVWTAGAALNITLAPTSSATVDTYGAIVTTLSRRAHFR